MTVFPLIQRITLAIIAACIGIAIALALSGCITPGIRIQTSYGTIGYSKDTNTVTYELPTDPGLRK
ncbi:MAG: hypothetical protein JW388_0954 [Nitrospira sp.]|nr:hypothetical protein [Nitrospira sp.]